MKETILTAVEAAEILKVKKNTVYDMIKRGDLPATKLGKQLRIRQADLEEYIRHGSFHDRKKSGEDIRTREPESRNYLDSTRESGSIVICGQDMVLDLLANRMSCHEQGCPAFRSYKGSYNALYAMYQGQVDVATCHLWHGATDTYNLPYVNSMLPGTDVVVIHLLKRNQGFYVPKGNPKNIFSFADLKRPDVTFANREPGSGSRVLLDEKLRQNHIRTDEVRGYHHVVNSHLEAAAAVARGEADVALGNEKHSMQVEGISFVFQQEESYDMVIRKEDFEKPMYQTLFSIICSEEYREEVAGLGGYDVADMGKILYTD